MDSEFEPNRPYIFNNPRQERIVKRLYDLVSPGASSFYQDACRIMAFQPPMPSTTHIVAHLLREVESSLRAVLEPFIPAGTQTAKNKDKQTDTHKKEILAITAALAIPPDDAIVIIWLNLVGRENTKAPHARAHRNALMQPRSLDSDFQNFWDAMELVLDAILARFEESYLKIFDQLNTLRKIEKPTSDNAKVIANHIPNNVVTYDYFFRDLTNPEWLKLLADEGIFSNPPEPVTNEDGSIYHPIWPQSHYLAKIASAAPDEVFNIVQNIETNNMHIQTDIVDVALSIPPSSAANLVPKICQWVVNISFLLSRKVGALVSYLARSQEIGAALVLTKEVLTLVPGQPIPLGPNSAGDPVYLTEPRPRINDWEYQQFLEHNFSDLVSAAPERSFNLIMESLAEAIRLGSYTQAENNRDFSEIWRSSVGEKASDYRRDDPRDLLITATRDTAIYLIQQNILPLSKIVSELINQRWTIFIRIALYLARRYGKEDIDIVIQLILNKDLFHSSQYRYDYSHLLLDYFLELSLDQQNVILKWIEQGPVIPEDEINKTEYKEIWQLRWLTILKSVLPAPWRERFERLGDQYGEPDHPDITFWSSGVMTGPKSPLSAEEMRRMNPDNLIYYLDHWQTSQEFTMDSPEGISRTLTSAIAVDPNYFLQSTGKFIGLDPTYVRGFLAGFHEALKAGIVFDWTLLFPLMEWVVNQDRNFNRQKVYPIGESDPDWGWTRTQIASLLEDGFMNEQNPIAFEDRERVWRILYPLTSDPNPTAIDEKSSSMDAATYSINTTRGVAFHALIQYSLWCKKSLSAVKGRRKKIGLNRMPEVRCVLEDHLNSELDPSTTIRSVYGRYFINLGYLDHAWLISRKTEIFSQAEQDQPLWNAAWGAYINFSWPYKDVFLDLQSEYRHALEYINTPPDPTSWGQNPNVRLVEHLMIFYGWGILDLTSDIFKTFWDTANDDLRGRALRFAGTPSEGTPTEVIDRYKQLWESRLKVIQGVEDKSFYIGELKEIGWWFVAEVYGDEWALYQLDQVLQITNEIEDAHLVIEHLASISEKHPYEAVTLLEKILATDKMRWEIYVWQENIRMILAKALAGGNERASQAAKIFINRLAARGYTDYASLIS